MLKVSVVLLVSSEERQKHQGNCESLVILLTWWQVGGDYDAGKSLFHTTFHIIQTRILVSIFLSHKYVPTIYDALFLYLTVVGGWIDAPFKLWFATFWNSTKLPTRSNRWYHSVEALWERLSMIFIPFKISTPTDLKRKIWMKNCDVTHRVPKIICGNHQYCNWQNGWQVVIKARLAMKCVLKNLILVFQINIINSFFSATTILAFKSPTPPVSSPRIFRGCFAPHPIPCSRAPLAKL